MSDRLDYFGELQALPTATLELLSNGSRLVELKKGEHVFGPGMAPKHFLLMISGCIRVQQVSEQGREIVLYRIHSGESCTLTTACILGNENYQAEGIVEQTSKAIIVPREIFDQLMADSGKFREFVFAAFGTRITDLMRIVEEVAFQRIETRLSQRLLELADGTDVVNMTHQKLSAELGSAREVISRQLKDFERNGWVELTRGVVNLIDVEALKKLASSQ